MAVVIETTAGDLTVDLFVQERPKACLNFLKLCKLKYYNYNLFHTIEHGFIAQTGDPSGDGDGGESVWGVIEGKHKRFFKAEYQPKIRHSEPGLLSMVSLGDNLIGAQFFFTLGHDLSSLDDVHCVIGQVTEGHDVLRQLNDAICDNSHRPYQDIRITHTVIIEDPFENPRGFREPSRSPSPTADRLKGGRIGADEDIDDTEGKTEQEVHEMLQEREAKARATILEIVGDLPDAEVAPPENVLFVCKLNPVTSDEDLDIIFSRFGKVKGCEVIRDRVSGDSLQYAFVEFEDSKTCESAYFKMDNVLIDDRRIHVDFSQSVAKVQWKGKGRGLIYKDGNKSNKLNFSDYKSKKGDADTNKPYAKNRIGDRSRNDRSRSPIQRPNRRRSRSGSQSKTFQTSNTSGNGNNRFNRNDNRYDRNDNKSGRGGNERYTRDERGQRDIRRDGSRDTKNESNVRDERHKTDRKDYRDKRNTRNNRDFRDVRVPRDERDVKNERDERDRREGRDIRERRDGRANKYPEANVRFTQARRSRSRSQNNSSSTSSRNNPNIEQKRDQSSGKNKYAKKDVSYRSSSLSDNDQKPSKKKHKSHKKKSKKKKSKKSKKVSSSESSSDTSPSSN